MVVISIYYDKRNIKKSYHLRLVQRLLLSDIGLSSCVIWYYIMQFIMNSTELEYFCDFYLPTVVYFFLCSYGWTVLLAFRFRSSHTEKKASGPPVPMWVVWATPLPLCLSIFITAFAAGDATTVQSNNSDTNQSCTFNHDSTTGIVLDLLTFQCPLLLTILVNCYSYSRGLMALRNTPHSVMARQMRKAGGYLGVLLVVWVPNIVYNFLTMFDGGDDEYHGFLDMVIVLSSLQGFLNVCVYVWSNRQMRSWFWRHLFCFVLFRGGDPRQQSTSQEDLVAAGAAGTDNPLNISSQLKRSIHDDDSSSDEEDEGSGRGLTESLTAGGHMGDGHSARAMEEGSSSSSSGRDTFSSLGGAGPSVSSSGSNRPAAATKSILIPTKGNIDGKVLKKGASAAQVAASADLDNERYVRFGE